MSYNCLIDFQLMLLISGLSSADYKCSTCNCTAAEFQSVAKNLGIPILNKGISKTSLSPWTYDCAVDIDRIPMFICNAVCDKSCIKLVHAKPAGIKVRINTFRRYPCSNGSYRLSKEDYNLIVGCTCII
uniref:Uncharacterized protein n=1 Tax=Cyprinus carpio TaxID=7962 RepID=A0A8C2K0K7_CYPCA